MNDCVLVHDERTEHIHKYKGFNIMALHTHIPNIHIPGEFQVAGWPWVTSSLVGTDQIEIQFPQVTSWFRIHNDEHNNGVKELFVGFGSSSFLPANSNYFTLHPGESSGDLKLKTRSIFLKSAALETPFYIVAGLTAIPTGSFPIMTGSEGWQGIG